MSEAKAGAGISIKDLYVDRKSLQVRLEDLKAQMGAIQTEIGVIEGQVDDLEITIRVIERRQGMQPQIPPPSSIVQAPAPRTKQGIPEVITWSASAKKVLETATRPLKTADILKEIEKSGRQFTGANRYSNLYSALSRNSYFKRTKRGWLLLKEKEGESASEG